MRLFLRIAAGLLLIYIACLGFAYWMMRKPPVEFASAIARMPEALFLVLPFETLWSQARAGTLHTGDAAPDFQLLSPDKKSAFHLAEMRGKKPVVLIFGSYT